MSTSDITTLPSGSALLTKKHDINAPGVAFRLLTEESKEIVYNSFYKETQLTRQRIFDNVQDPGFLMLRACSVGAFQVVSEMLDMGFNPSVIGNPNGTSRTMIPLAWCCRGGIETPEREKVADLLLSKGADLNLVVSGSQFEGDVSAMHAACGSPKILEKLISHGGNVNIRGQDGWGVLDHWLWHMHSPSKENHAPGMEALDILVREGIETRVHDGSSFLASCWGSGFLRNRLKSIIDKGFDPYDRGTAKGVKGASLMEHLEKKVKAGKGGKLAAQLVTEHNAQILDANTVKASARGSSPRL